MKKSKNNILKKIFKRSIEFNNKIRNNNKSNTPNYYPKILSKESSFNLEKTEKEMFEKFYLKRREGLKGIYNHLNKSNTSREIDKLKNKINLEFNFINNKISFVQVDSEKKKFNKNIEKLKKKKNKFNEKSKYQFSKLYKRTIFDKNMSNKNNENDISVIENYQSKNINKLTRINFEKEVIRSRDILDDIMKKRIEERSKLFSKSLMNLDSNKYIKIIKNPKTNNLINENNLSRIIRLKKIEYNMYDIDKDDLCKYNCKYLQKFGRELNNSTSKIIEGTLPEGCKRTFSKTTIFKFKSLLGNQ